MAVRTSEPMTYTAVPDSAGRLFSASVQLDTPIDLLCWLAAFPDEPRLYWRNGGDGAIYAGVSAAAILGAAGLERFESIRAQLRHLFDGASRPINTPAAALPRLFGGFSYY